MLQGDPESAQGATWTYRGSLDRVTFDLQGILLKPAGGGPFGAVVISHGAGGHVVERAALQADLGRERDARGDEAREGVAVLLVSAELDEILALSDRIAVMFKGKIIAIVPAAQATREGLGLLMAGIVDERRATHGVEEANVNRA